MAHGSRAQVALDQEVAVEALDPHVPEAQRLAAEQGQSYQIPSNSKTAIPGIAPRFQDFRVIKYDFLTYGSATTRDRLVKKWTSEVFPLPK